MSWKTVGVLALAFSAIAIPAKLSQVAERERIECSKPPPLIFDGQARALGHGNERGQLVYGSPGKYDFKIVWRDITLISNKEGVAAYAQHKKLWSYDACPQISDTSEIFVGDTFAVINCTESTTRTYSVFDSRIGYLYSQSGVIPFLFDDNYMYSYRPQENDEGIVIIRDRYTQGKPPGRVGYVATLPVGVIPPDCLNRSSGPNTLFLKSFRAGVLTFQAMKSACNYQINVTPQDQLLYSGPRKPF